jgi:hypothetical protein
MTPATPTPPEHLSPLPELMMARVRSFLREGEIRLPPGFEGNRRWSRCRKAEKEPRTVTSAKRMRDTRG